MPGVPKSRGCNSCLKQKKKCDQAKPACSRCARLEIPCVGSGEQKYVFKPVSFTKPFKTSFSKPRKRETPAQVSISHKPQSPLTLLQAKLVAALETTDLRYGLSCYGDFLEHIPPRLGHSHALDASVDLMMSALPYHYTPEIPSQVLAKYGSSLKVLRDTQNETGTKLSPEDVAAFHIMMICQSWLGQTDNGLKSHDKQVLTRYLDTVTEKGCSITFELQLLETSLVALFFEALVDPRIELERYVSRLRSQSRQNEYDSNPDSISGYFQVQRLLRIPRFRQEPLRYMEEIKITYQELQDDHARILHHLESVIHRLNVTEAILLMTALALNSILRATYPDDSVLLLEASTLANELIALAKGVSQYRPLGASYIPPCLVAAWATTSALETQKNEIERLFAEYQHDYARIKWMDQAVSLKVLHRTLLERISGPNTRDKVEKSENDRNLKMLIVHCKAVFGSIGSSFFPSS
ncbi:uncharacterized protein FTJAE_13872 [Fusarium tjaetaba]|uniref:Zn(2)-C6 fungal-type domain-containing protein n=1 Tax=Fusarium tjaetaba TaxID=1567544 RepID=A0A8H5QD76_9HYPO|nr:uncharacterized protein FTJAE_13872 [Fusarium tjaetaba]KAF5613661.1 hypothetical protein FTJAE_13872 [Fusarium tjaetaba]